MVLRACMRACLRSGLTVLALAQLPAGAAERPATLPDTLEQRLQACASCHARQDANGAYLNDAYFPRISGKPAGYLYNQLRNFQDGRRQYPMMTYMVAHLPDAYLKEIAAHYADQHLPTLPPAAAQPAVAPALLARGRQLVMQGDSTLKVPACIACHGQHLTGVAPAIPGLLGLPRDYLNAQFGAWRNGARRAHAPDCMAQIAGRLSVADVGAISSYLVSQPVDPRARPAASITLPLPCGSASN